VLNSTSMDLISYFQTRKGKVSISSIDHLNAWQCACCSVISQVIQNTPRTRERCNSVQCNKSSSLVCGIYLSSAHINNLPEAIHATDLTLGLLCIPAGFHVVVKTNGAEWQTSNKPVHIDQVLVAWNEPILLYVVLDLIFPADIKKDSRLCKHIF
jgi:hypothetical protein